MIRQATQCDVESLSLLIHEAWQKDLVDLVATEASAGLSVELFASKLREDMSSEAESVIVHEISGAIAGYASGHVEAKGFDSEIVGLYVSPGAQQRGVGSQLFTEMKRLFKSQGKSNMVVWTLLGAPNNRFYLKNKPTKMLHRDIVMPGASYPGIGFVYSL